MRVTSQPFAVFFTGLAICAGASLMPSHPSAQPMQSSATTEKSCSFGMAKGDGAQTCKVPIPVGCVVANFPGSTKPWTTISKGGKTFCRFDEKQTDWKTKITGACERCNSGQCSAQFSVRFDCSGR